MQKYTQMKLLKEQFYRKTDLAKLLGCNPSKITVRCYSKKLSKLYTPDIVVGKKEYYSQAKVTAILEFDRVEKLGKIKVNQQLD